MKKLVILLFIVLSSLSAYSSFGYSVLKNIVSEVKDKQNIIELYRLLINSKMGEVEKECKDIPKGQKCIISKNLSVGITQEMQKYANGDATIVIGNTIDIPSETLIYTKLVNDDKYDFQIDINIGAIDPNADSFKVKYRWSKNGIDKSITFSDNVTGLTENYSMTVENGMDTFTSYGTMSNQSGGTDKFRCKLQQYDKNIDGVYIELTSDITLPDLGNTVFSIVGKADKLGGYTHTKFTNNLGTFEEEETFDGAGNSTGLKYKDENGWHTEDAIDDDSYSISENDINSTVDIGVENGTSLSSPTFLIVVKSGEDPKKAENLIGFGDYIDENSNGIVELSELHFDYFGDNSLLADSNATTDTDNLDIYDSENKNNPISGIFLKNR